MNQELRIGYANQNGSAITAAATALLFFVTGLLGYLAWEQGHTARAQLRAYVFVEKPAIYDGPTWPNVTNPVQSGCPNGGITIRNLGSTPAFNVRHWAAVIASTINFDGRLPANTLTYPDNVIRALSPTTIGPSASTILTRNLGRPLTPNEIQMLANPNPSFALVLYGRITYDDTFGVGHVTDYSLGWSGHYPVAQNTTLTFLAEGNRAT